VGCDGARAVPVFPGRPRRAALQFPQLDPQSLADKGAYAKANGLGGIIIWTISQGYLASQPLGQRDPLLEALRASYLQ